MKSKRSVWLVDDADFSWLTRFRMDLSPQTATRPRRNDLTDGFIDTNFSQNFIFFSTCDNTSMFALSKASTK